MFLINDLNWFEDLSEFDGGFIKICKKEVMQDVSLKIIFKIQKNYTNFIMIYYFY